MLPALAALVVRSSLFLPPFLYSYSNSPYSRKRSIEGLVAKYDRQVQTTDIVDRRNAFGIWQGLVWIADDFDAPLDDLLEYM